MAYEFKSLADVEILTEVPEGASVFAEVGGAIKRVPGEGLGGAGIKTAIIKDSEYDNTLAGLATAISAAPAVTYSCINMTFEEAYQIMASGEPLACLLMTSLEGAMNLPGMSGYAGAAVFGVPCIMLGFAIGSYTAAQLYWTADGISTEEPSSGK